MEAMSPLLFAIPCAVLLPVIIRNLFFPDRAALSYLQSVQEIGFRKTELKASLPRIAIGLAFLGASRLLPFGTLWAILGTIALVLPLFFYFHQRADKDVAGMHYNTSDEFIAIAAKKRRLNTIYKIMLLFAWCFSWYWIL